MDVKLIIAWILSAAIACLSKPLLISMLKEIGMMERNFRQESIPIGMGLFFIAPLLVFSFLARNLLSFHSNFSPLFLLGSIGMSFVGFIDDLSRDKANKGFKGHFKSLFHGQLSTGMLKAMAGGMLSIYLASFLSDNFWTFLLDSLLMLMFTNFMNLWDLRPGRAAKVFLLIDLCLIGAIVGLFKEVSALLILCLILVFIYIRDDLQAKYMMGDTGANLLGMALGVTAAYALDTPIKIVMLAVLLLFNGLSERCSFTKMIEHNRILNFIDKIGRGE